MEEYKIRRQPVQTISLSKERVFWLVVKFAKNNPEVVEAILKAKEKEDSYRKINCPFPFRCNSFPCKTLHCNADECHNGHTFRRS